MTIATIQIDFGSQFILPPSTPAATTVNVRLMQGENEMEVHDPAFANPLEVSFNQGPGEYVAVIQGKGPGGENVGDPISHPVVIPVERLVPVSVTQV